MFRAWEGEGLELSNLSASTSVVAALSFWDYSLLLSDSTGGDTYKATGRCFSVAAGRISYSYALKGSLPNSNSILFLALQRQAT